jgi:hypothetical protein
MADLPEKAPREFVDYLGEGMHTAFRKGGDGPRSSQVWNLINDMSPEEWHGVVQFLADGMWPMVLDYAAGREIR